MDFKDRIRQLREALGLSQDKFASKVEVSKGSIGNWESGKNTPLEKDMRHISAKTGASFDWLREGVGTMWPGDRRPAPRPSSQDVPATIDGVPVIDVVMGGEAVQRMPLVVGGQVLAYVTVTIKIEPAGGHTGQTDALDSGSRAMD